MKKDEEVESIVKKINDEIQQVKNHVSDAKYNLSIDNYSEALLHLKQAEKTSTCSYCQQKVKEIIFEIEYNKNICNIHSKSCDSNKTGILQKIEDFNNKLPNIEEIKRNKAINPSQSRDFDIIGNVAKSFDEMGKSFGTIWANMFKF